MSGELVVGGWSEQVWGPQEEAVFRWHHLMTVRTQVDSRQPHLELCSSYTWVLCLPAQDGTSNPIEIHVVGISKALRVSKRSGKIFKKI